MSANTIRFVFIAFLIITFFVGAYVYVNINIPATIAKFEGLENQDPQEEPGQENDKNTCPDLLIRRGKLLYLVNTTNPEVANENPRVFNNLDEYVKYFESQREKGKSCPALVLQQETNTQGKDVYRVLPNPLASSPYAQPNTKPVKSLDASRENGYNQNMYAGFDPHGQYVGQYTDLDVIHDSTEKAPTSDNPMDANWGGVLYTQSQVESGKYKDNEITPTAYITPKGGEVIPIPNPNIPPYPSQDQQMVPMNTRSA